MCYDIQAKLESQLKRAIRKNSVEDMNAILEKLERFNGRPMFHLSGFDHPELLIYTNEAPDVPTAATWGLVPSWTKNESAKLKIINSTLNAKGETIFDKPSFKESAQSKRCILQVDGFFEHKHINGKTYPHFISRADGHLMTLGGLWSEWKNPLTRKMETSFSIITTRANQLMSGIHNNPKLAEPRMPLILPPNAEDLWLRPTGKGVETLSQIIKPAENALLEAHPVGRLKGKEYTGNNANITERAYYAAIDGGDQLSFFEEES
ncbi:MAG: putative SOS response-associated peptidase YedK [Flavobacteriaceae bacterium]|jgi:putative SOS response-associated peptidase YedK